jgi:hypothetical protein
MFASSKRKTIVVHDNARAFGHKLAAQCDEVAVATLYFVRIRHCLFLVGDLRKRDIRKHILK